MELVLRLLEASTAAVFYNEMHSHSFPLADVLPVDVEKEHIKPLHDPKGYGAQLFDALFPGGSSARKAIDAHPKQIVLVCTEPALQSIPWEYLYGPGGYVVCQMPFTRALPEGGRRKAPKANMELSITVVAANPLSDGITPVPADEEWERLCGAMKDAGQAAVVCRARPATVGQLRKLIANKRQQVIHFIGHGMPTSEGVSLCFEKEDSSLHAVGVMDFKHRLGDAAFLVTLNSCWSAAEGVSEVANIAFTLIKEGVPYTVGMQYPILVTDAQIFSAAFYADLARGSTVEEAVFQARMALADDGSPGAVGLPALYTSLNAPTPGFTPPAGTFRFSEVAPLPPIDLFGIPQIEGTFQGRKVELVQIGKLLTGSQRPRWVTVHGEGGQGKTALARVALERFAWAFPGGVCAVGLDMQPDLPAVLMRLAGFLGIEMQTLTPEQRERVVMQRLAQARTLLLLDNAETLIEAAEDRHKPTLELLTYLRERLPETVCILVTSRRPLNLAGEQVIPLGGLSDAEGGRLFLEWAKDRNVTQKEAEGVSLRVGGHALSLRILGATFNELAISLDEFNGWLEKYIAEAFDKYREFDHRQRSLFASIDTSVVYLEQKLIDTLSMLWLFQSPFRVEEAVKILEPENEDSPVAGRLRALWQRGLLGREEVTLADGTLELYRLLPALRVYARRELWHRTEESELLARYGIAYAKLAHMIFQEHTRSATLMYLARAAGADLDAGLKHCPVEEIGWYSNRWGFVLIRLGSSWKGQRLLEQALETGQEGGDWKLELHALNHLGILCRATGRPQQALAYYQQSLKIVQEVGDRAGEVATLNNIGGVYQSTGRPQQALTYFERALKIAQEVGDRASMADMLNNIGVIYWATGQLEKSLDYYQQVLLIRREVGDRTGEADTLNNIGGFYFSTGQPGKALEYIEQALSIRRELGDRAGEANTLNNIGGVYDSTGQLGKALENFDQALPIMREVGNRAGEATTLYNIARIFLNKGQTEDAVCFLGDVIEITRQIGASHSEARSLFALAEVLDKRLRRREEAIRLMEQSIRLMQEQRLERDDLGRTLADHKAFLAHLRLSMRK